MATNFPAFKPTSRRFTPASYAVKRFTAINGAGSNRLYGSKPFDAELNLQFILDDTALALLIKCWNDSYGSYDTLVLPQDLFSGMNETLYSSITDDLSHLQWRWAENPSIEGLREALSRVSVKLIATLEAT